MAKRVKMQATKVWVFTKDGVPWTTSSFMFDIRLRPNGGESGWVEMMLSELPAPRARGKKKGKR